MNSVKRELTISKVIVFGIFAELLLILMQFAYMAAYERSHPGSNLTFDKSYMEHVGFFIFQIVGFFLFIIAAYYIFRRSFKRKFKKVIIFLVTGGILELAFFLFATEFEPAFIYSILDKVVAVVFAGIIYWASQSKVDYKEGSEA